MSKSDIDIEIRADASAALKDIGDITFAMAARIRRALMIAAANNYEADRLVIGHRLARRIGWHPLHGWARDADERSIPSLKKLWGVPFVVDETTPEGFGVVTRSPPDVR